MGQLRRELSAWDAVGVVVGAIVGVGIFFTPSRVAALAGDAPMAMLAWAVGGGIALLGALTFAELGGLYPRTGGQYDILRDAYGTATAFVYVLCNATAIQAGAVAIIALVCVDNGVLALTGRPPDTPATTGLAVLLVLGLSIANAAGVRWGVRIQNATVIAKLATLVAVTALALAWDGAPHEAPVAAGPSQPIAALAAALVPTLFAFGGWQQALWMGGEVVAPERNVPRAILVGVSIVVAVYLLANWSYLHILGHAAVAGSDTLAADTVAAVVGDGGRRVVGGAVAISAAGVLNAQLLTGPRLVYALAADGRFFAAFARVRGGTGTPIAAIALIGGIAVALLVVVGERGVDRLLTGVVFVDGVFFALTGLATLVLLRSHPRAQRALRMPGFPVVPVLFVAAELGVVVGACLDPAVRAAAGIGAAWIVAAIVLYALCFRRPRS